MPGVTTTGGVVPPPPRDFGGGGYPYPHPHGFGSGREGTRVTPSPHDENDDEISLHFGKLPRILTVLIFRVSIDSSSRRNDTKTTTKFRYIWDKCLEFPQS